MSDERYYKVTIPVVMTIRADDIDQAIDIAVEAVGNTVGGTVRGVSTNQALSSAELIDYSPEELAKVERWLASDS